MKTKIDVPYNPIITHDVDRFYKWRTLKSIFGESGRILRGQSSWSFNEAWNSFLNKKENDPFSNLIEIAELDKSYGLQSVFYIMTTEDKHPKNINDYSVNDKRVRQMLKEVMDIGSEIGLHPGIYTFEDPKKMQEQKTRLEDSIQKTVVRSRQHYLKFEYPETFIILESIGIKNDSSILVDLSNEEDKERCTTYTMTDEDGIGLNISQTPLIFMDTHHMQMKDDAILSLLERSVAPAKKSGGEIMILWHNNNISNSREIGLYKEVLQVVIN